MKYRQKLIFLRTSIFINYDYILLKGKEPILQQQLSAEKVSTVRSSWKDVLPFVSVCLSFFLSFSYLLSWPVLILCDGASYYSGALKNIKVCGTTHAHSCTYNTAVSLNSEVLGKAIFCELVRNFVAYYTNGKPISTYKTVLRFVSILTQIKSVYNISLYSESAILILFFLIRLCLANVSFLFIFLRI
jgi:hypothetical protein